MRFGAEERKVKLINSQRRGGDGKDTGHAKFSAVGFDILPLYLILKIQSGVLDTCLHWVNRDNYVLYRVMLFHDMLCINLQRVGGSVAIVP